MSKIKIEVDDKNIVALNAMSIALKTIADHRADAFIYGVDEGEGDETVTEEVPVPPVTEEVPVPPVTEEEVPVPPPVTEENPYLDVNGDAVDVDSKGYPWDKRINSSAKTVTGDGTWKLLRIPKEYNKDAVAWQAFIDSVKAELRGEEAPVPPVTEEVPVTEEEAPVPPPVTEEEVPPPVTEEEVPNDFPSFMTFVSANEESFDIPKVIEVCTKYGVSNLMELQGKLELLPSIHGELLTLIGE